MDAEKMVDGSHVCQRKYFGRQASQRLFLIIFEHVIGNLVRRAECIAVDCAQVGQVFLRGGTLAVIIGVSAEIADLVGITHVAAKQRTDRIALQAGFVFGSEKRSHPRTFGRNRLCGGRGLGIGGNANWRKHCYGRKQQNFGGLHGVFSK